MSIADTQQIDMVATKPGTNVVRLIIADPTNWDHPDDHSLLLQEKVNTYIAFIETGQLARTTHPPIPKDPAVEICLVAHQMPTATGLDHIRKVEQFLAGIGLKFRLEIRP